MDDEYLIWSNDAGAWWNPNGAGYTLSTGSAGRYTRQEAIRKCCHGRDGWNSNGVTPEIPVRLADVIEIEAMKKERDLALQAQRS